MRGALRDAVSATLSTHPEPGAPRVESADVREQLERLLENSLFRNSKRYPALLRHVVEATLDGRSSDLKERLLGVQVFGRPADYDTNVDPVVRTSAAEIRKRMAQYYLEPAHSTELRIELPLGSYVPEFRWPARAVEPAPAASAVTREPITAPAAAAALIAEEKPATSAKRVLSATIVSLAFAAAIALFWSHPWSKPTALDDFWRPLLREHSPVVICVGLYQGGVAWSDATALANIAGAVGERRKPFQIRREDVATFTELSQGPAILIGAFNDNWTLLLNQNSRFSFARDSTADWISDRDHPGSRDWSVSSNRVDSGGHHVYSSDYAIVSRILDPRTGSLVVTAAGLHGYGTAAAGEFVTRPDLFEQFASRAPRGWQPRDLQIVLRTEVINGNSGPPRMVAYSVW